MKKNYFYAATVLLAAITLIADAQAPAPRLPEPSSTQTIIQDFGLGKITVTYSRPNVKDRIVFGGITPYGQVWRTGANSATTIDFSENVIIEGHPVPAGSYSLFTIPNKDEWAIILNKTVKQWGAYSYKEADDFLRFTEKPVNVDEKRETFTIQFANATTKSTDLSLIWDHTKVAIHMNTDDDALIMANIDALMKGDKKPYTSAIQYYYENNKDMKIALGWAMEAEKADPKSAQYKLWEARIHLKMGDKTAAATAAQQGIDLAKAAKNDDGVKQNQQVLDQAKS